MPSFQDYSSLRSQLLEGNITCKDRILFHLGKISASGNLNAFLEVYEKEALDSAAEIDRKIQQGKAGKLAGMVIGLKDVLNHQGHTLQAGGKILDGFQAQFNATAVQRLLDEDAIIIGRQNCDEFAMGSSNENSAFGPVRNPVAADRVPGGSSGGSAAAVAADLCQVSIGSDTGGSVRQPAAFCGLFGLKPTYSRVSRHGLIAYASSFDCIGVLAHSVRDCALVLEVIAGQDAYDSTVSSQPVPEYSREIQKRPAQKLRFAILGDIPTDSLQPEIALALKSTADKLMAAGHTVTPVNFPLNRQILATYYILTTAEASSNLSRFDGVRYGYRVGDVAKPNEMYRKSRSGGFGPEVQRRVLLGSFVLSSDYYDAYYVQAQKVRRMIRDGLRYILSEHDIILMPVTPTTAFKLGSKPENPIEMYLADLFSVQANVAGLPAIAFPAGLDSQGLPIGLQLMADDFKEPALLAATQMIMDLP